MNSKFGTLSKLDFWKGLIVAIITAMFTALMSTVGAAMHLSDINWQFVILSGITSFLAYIFKNLFTNSNGQPFTTELKPENKIENDNTIVENNIKT